MIYGPYAIGSIPGILILISTYLLRKKSIYYSMIPTLIGLIAVIVLVIISFEIRGFEGAGYALLSMPILVFSIVSLIVAIINNNKRKSEKSHN